ncbi:MAG: lipid-A-disaccharide synthase N-terminal domain-containing protein [Planctomycetes bacterium]|nr:lipid-A-disaccharide synthase N-terminal domain-containing protein [Planctomycetota bacterium]MCB9919009.1 lipid-A-disaccharide synthase N-terminal domain-containing protein [Planctomycetota bacterium]
MAVLFALGLWIVVSPARHGDLPALREGARTVDLRIGNARGVLEAVGSGEQATYRILWRDGEVGESFDARSLDHDFGRGAADRILDEADNPLFRILSITSWSGVVWVLVGFLGQALFFARMAVQWIVSEREKRSVVPRVFWVFSLAGAVMLFAYFAWRRDIIGILGQTTGIVIYARNLRLITKEARRQSAQTTA